MVFGCRNACGVADRIDIVEVDDIISYRDIVAEESWGAHATRVLVAAPSPQMTRSGRGASVWRSHHKLLMMRDSVALE